MVISVSHPKTVPGWGLRPTHPVVKPYIWESQFSLFGVPLNLHYLEYPTITAMSLFPKVNAATPQPLKSVSLAITLNSNFFPNLAWNINFIFHLLHQPSLTHHKILSVLLLKYFWHLAAFLLFITMVMSITSLIIQAADKLFSWLRSLPSTVQQITGLNLCYHLSAGSN